MKMNFSYLKIGHRLVAAVLIFGLLARSAQALPSFAQQTGQPCAACHVGGFGPQLTAYGRDFKLGGYTATDDKDGHIPLAAMVVGSWTHTKKNQSADAGPYDGTNNNASLQQLSIFFAGAISDFVGAFIQATYSDITRKVAVDNIDVRFARDTEIFGEDAIVGASFNNNPTVQDVSNSVPAWRFPFMSSELAPASIASPLIDGALAQQVIGISTYGYWNDSIYAEIGGYKTLSKSVLDDLNTGSENAIHGVAPYWRLAYMRGTDEHSYSLGAFGLTAALLPGQMSGEEDKYNDIGIDASYQHLGDREHIFTFNSAFIHEDQNLKASLVTGTAENQHNNLSRFDIGGSYFYQQTYGLSLAHFDIRGSLDSGLFAVSDPDVSSATGKPDSSGWVIQADWTPLGKAGAWGAPWINLRVGLQYTLYDKFNGAAHNYDGFGRDARDNDTLFGFVWFAL